MKKLLSFMLCCCLTGIFSIANAALNPELEQFVLHYKATDQQFNASNDVHVLDPWVAKHGGRLANEIKKQAPYDQRWPGVDQDVFQLIKDMCTQYATDKISILNHGSGEVYYLSTEGAQAKLVRAIDHLQSLRTARDEEGDVTDVFGNSNTTNLLTASVAIILSYSENVAQQRAIIRKFVKRMLDAEGTCLQGQTNRLVGFLVIDVLQYKTSTVLAGKRDFLIEKYKGKREVPGQAHPMFEPQIIEALAQDSGFIGIFSEQDIQQIINEFKLSNEGEQWLNQEIQAKIAMVNQAFQVRKQVESCQAPQITVTKEDAKAQLRKIYESRMSQNADMIAVVGEDYVKKEVKGDIKRVLVSQYAKGRLIVEILPK